MLSSRKWSSTASSTAKCLVELEQTAGLGAIALVMGASEASLFELGADSVKRLIPLLAEVHAIVGMVHSISNIIWALSTSKNEEEHFIRNNESNSILPHIKKEIYIKSSFEFVANLQLLLTSFEASNLAAHIHLLPSIGFVYLSFAIKALVDIGLAARTMYTFKGDAQHNEARTNLILQTFKFAGWTALTCGSALGGWPLLLGYAFLGVAAAFHLTQSATLGIAGAKKVWNYSCRDSFSYLWNSNTSSAKSPSALSSLTIDPTDEIRNQAENALTPAR